MSTLVQESEMQRKANYFVIAAKTQQSLSRATQILSCVVSWKIPVLGSQNPSQYTVHYTQPRPHYLESLLHKTSLCDSRRSQKSMSYAWHTKFIAFNGTSIFPFAFSVREATDSYCIGINTSFYIISANQVGFTISHCNIYGPSSVNVLDSVERSCPNVKPNSVAPEKCSHPLQIVLAPYQRWEQSLSSPLLWNHLAFLIQRYDICWRWRPHVISSVPGTESGVSSKYCGILERCIGSCFDFGQLFLIKYCWLIGTALLTWSKSMYVMSRQASSSAALKLYAALLTTSSPTLAFSLPGWDFSRLMGAKQCALFVSTWNRHTPSPIHM